MITAWVVGDLKEILSLYTDVTGKGQVPPRWSFGYWQSKISYSSAAKTLEMVRAMRAAALPMDVLHLDTHWFKDDWYCDLEFDRGRFPDPAAYLAELRGLGVKVSLWQLPYIPEGCRLFDDLARADAFVKTPAGEMYDIGISYAPAFEGRVGCIDWTNPAARRVYAEHLEYQDDPTTWHIGDQWLLGDALLVAPIHDESNRRRVYVPQECWSDWWSGERVVGRRWIDVAAPLEHIPPYVREGAVVPLGPVRQYVDERPTDAITLRIAPFAGDGETRVSVPLDGKSLEVHYRARGGEHAVDVVNNDIAIDVEIVSASPVPVRIQIVGEAP